MQKPHSCFFNCIYLQGVDKTFLVYFCDSPDNLANAIQITIPNIFHADNIIIYWISCRQPMLNEHANYLFQFSIFCVMIQHFYVYISTSEMDISLVLLEAFQHFSSGQLSAFIQIIMVKNMANSVYFIWEILLIFQICNSIYVFKL